eukprot:2453860-Heterocapsa_arctica.AAC.1
MKDEKKCLEELKEELELGKNNVLDQKEMKMSLRTPCPGHCALTWRTNRRRWSSDGVENSRLGLRPFAAGMNAITASNQACDPSLSGMASCDLHGRALRREER